MGHDEILLLAGLLGTAFLGSWHCAGMCGAIAANFRSRGALIGYQAGRGFAYVILGVAAGLAGERFLVEASPGFRVIAALVLAVALLLHRPPAFFERWLRARSLTLWRLMFRFRAPPPVAGLLTGFLPCAWLWTFLAAAAATGRPSTGALVLFALWLGGLPALVGMGVYFRRGLGTAQGRAARWAPRVVMLAGLYSLAAHFL